MKIAFTLCSNNYFSQALVLGRSFLSHNPGFSFYVGLVDKKSVAMDYGSDGIHVLEIGDIEPDIYELASRYNIVELNTAVKPRYFLHFFLKLDAEEVFYLDPDICVYRDFGELSLILETSDILLTPHILTPIPIDGKTPMEPDFLNFGLYNLGFLGLRQTANTLKMLEWWRERTYRFGYHDLAKGLFVDQLWMNLVPVLFRKCHVSHHPGLNIGPWNFHERWLKKEGGSYLVNDRYPLLFFHFSTFNPVKNFAFHPVFNRFSMAERPDLAVLYKEYADKLEGARFAEFNKIPCHYVEWKKERLLAEGREAAARLTGRDRMVRKMRKMIPGGFRKFILKLAQT